MNPRDAWDIAFSQLELQLDRASFDTWLRDATFLSEEAGVFVIGVRNIYARDMLQHRLYRNVARVVNEVYGAEVELRFEVHKPVPNESAKSADMPLFRLLAQQDMDTPTIPLRQHVARIARPDLPESELNARFTFERFIVNQSNHMTYEAARAVSEHPATVYNPLMIYGGVGLGKTHLLQAVAHTFRSKGLRFIYISSEAFTNDMVDAIRQRTTAMFRDKYRSADVLLVDDIQFIAGKESTQEEFFHTFNTLHTFNKQIVLASDRHPSQLTTLEDRLRSRFEGGLVMDVQPPEYETRVAILDMWAREREIVMPREVREMIARRCATNVRELEGVFNQMAVKMRLGQQSLTLATAETALERFERPRQAVTLKAVIDATADEYGFSAADLVGTRRNQRLNEARQVAMYLARDLTAVSLPQIGAIFGGRSHTTVLYGCNKVQDSLETDDDLRCKIEAVRDTLMKAAH